MSILAVKFQITQICYPTKLQKDSPEIATDVNFLQLDSENILNSFKALKLSPVFSEFQKVKRCGFSLQLLVSLMIWSLFNGNKPWIAQFSLIASNGASVGKDAFFRLKNNSKITAQVTVVHLSSICNNHISGRSCQSGVKCLWFLTILFCRKPAGKSRILATFTIM